MVQSIVHQHSTFPGTEGRDTDVDEYDDKGSYLAPKWKLHLRIATWRVHFKASTQLDCDIICHASGSSSCVQRTTLLPLSRIGASQIFVACIFASLCEHSRYSNTLPLDNRRLHNHSAGIRAAEEVTEWASSGSWPCAR